MLAVYEVNYKLHPSPCRRRALCGEKRRQICGQTSSAWMLVIPSERSPQLSDVSVTSRSAQLVFLTKINRIYPSLTVSSFSSSNTENSLIRGGLYGEFIKK